MKKIIAHILIFLLSSALIAQNKPSQYIGTNLSRGLDLRILRFAVSCRGEFTQSVTGANDEELPKHAQSFDKIKEFKHVL